MKIRSIPIKTLTQRLTSTGTKLYLSNINDWDDTVLTSSEFPTTIYAVLRNSDRTQLEIIAITASTIADAITGTGATISGRALPYDGTTTADTETAYDWDANETYCELGANPPQLYENLIDKDRAQTITGKKTFSTVPASTAAAVSGDDLVNKTLLDSTALGTTTVDAVVISGTAGATVAVDQLVYLDPSDQEWKLCDADTAGTVDNVKLGIARGAGTDGNAISGGVHTLGKYTAGSAIFTAGEVFASNTAGGFASSAGTTEVSLGIATSTTVINFYPRFNQQLTENQQDALAGTEGTPSASNKYVTADALATQVAAIDTDIQTFTDAGADTWTKPTNAKMVEVVVIGAGGGGGGGDSGGTGGGGGGGAGGWGHSMFQASVLGATEDLVVGAGGAGGAAETTGSNGAATTFGTVTLLRAAGGSGGVEGDGSRAAGASGSANGTILSSDGGAAGNGGDATTGSSGTDTASSPAPRGGGGGAGGSANGGAGGAFITNYAVAGGTAGTSGTAPTADAGDGNAGGLTKLYGGTGGGGGGSTVTSGTAGAGGDGVDGGGGGGGGSSTSGTGGAGGAGGDGAVIVITYF